MLKILIWPACVLITVIAVCGQNIPSHNSHGRVTIDTIKLNKLVFEADRDAAATYLSGYLDSQPDAKGKQFAGAWLDLSILLAWSEKIAESDSAFSIFLGSSAGLPDNPLLKANRLLYQALKLSSADSLNQAADILVASIVIRPDHGTLNRMLLADSYGKLGRLYKRTSQPFESSRNFERSISINRELGRKVVLAEDLSDWSSVLSTINSSDTRIDTALNESWLKYRNLKKSTEEANVLNEFGVLFNRRGKIRESLQSFKKSLRVKFGITGLEPQEFIAVNSNIGHCYEYLANPDSARFYFLKAIDYARLSKDLDIARYLSRLASLYANIGASYGREGKPTQAIHYFQEALKCLDSTCSLTDPSTNPGISKVTRQIADYTARKAYGYHERYSRLHDTADLIRGMKIFMDALEMMDTLRFKYSFDDKPLLSSEAKIHFFYALDMALDLYKQTGEKKYLDSAFLLSERNKSATLNEFLRTNRARKNMAKRAPWIDEEDSIKQIINTIESEIINAMSGKSLSKDSIISMENRKSHLTDTLKIIGDKARRLNPDYFERVYSDNSYLPADIQKLINPGEALVDYTVVRNEMLNLDNMIIIVLTRDTLFTYRDTLPNQFRADIQAFRESITPYGNARVFQEFSRLANLMYRYFFAPVEKFHGINKLIILPDEELGFLPFEAFVSDTLKPTGSDFRKLSYLNRKYQISYISSHEQLHQFPTKPRKSAKPTIYAFAPFVSKGIILDSMNLSSLENSAKEIHSVSSYFRTKLYQDEQAGELSLRRAFQRESVISLSTHGIMDPAHPMESRLLLNPSEPDGSLYLFEMMSLEVMSSLVILNACNTGTGELQVGEGIMSMARGFQYAGVPSVITTLWPIDDRSSSTIMNFFFQNLHRGMDQRAALAKARNDYIDQSSKASGAPYFWAGQVLIGYPGNLTIRERTNPLLLVIPLLLAALIFTSFLVYHKKAR